MWFHGQAHQWFSQKWDLPQGQKNILRAYNINDWQSEPYHQNQNPSEWRYRTFKAWANTIMNSTGALAHCWLLAHQYMCYILNHICTASLGGQVLLQVLYGVTYDISIMLLYTFNQPYFILLMITISLLKVKSVLHSVLVLQSIVWILLPTWF